MGLPASIRNERDDLTPTSRSDLETALPRHPSVAHLQLERVGRRSARHSELVEYRCGATPGRAAVLLKWISHAANHARAVEAASREFRALERVRALVGPALSATLPEPLLLLPEDAALVVSKVPGVPLSQILRRAANRVAGPWQGRRVVGAVDHVGRWLRDFHGATAQDARPFDSGRFLADVRLQLDRCAAAGLEGRLGESLWETATKAGRAASGTMEPTAARHGDFLPQNILVDGARISVIDLENFAERDSIYADLGAMASWLRLMAASPLYSPRTIRAARERLLLSYGGTVSTLLLSLHEFRMSLTVIAELNPKANRVVRWQRRRWLSAAVSRLARQIDGMNSVAPRRASVNPRENVPEMTNSPPPPAPEVVRYRVGSSGYQDVVLYDAVRYEGPANEYKQRVMSEAYRRLIGPLAGKRILDVGCGTGRGMVEFSSQAGWVVGCDASVDMLQAANGKLESTFRTDLVAAYAQYLPLASDSFDLATTLNFLHLFSLDTQRAMVAEMIRVVKPGGTVLLEFDNALHGLIVGPWKRWRNLERGSLPSEIRFVIGDQCRVDRVYGAVLPVVWRLFRFLPALFVPLEKIAYLPLLNRLSHRVYYRLVKP